MSANTKQAPLWTKSFFMLIFANWFVFMGFQMLIPTFPPYIQSLGASSLEIGLVTTLFSVGAVFARPFIGYLLSFNKRRPMVLLGVATLLVLTILYPVTQIIFIFLLFRLVHGLAWGWTSTSNGTAAVDLVPNSRIGEGMGYYGLSVTLSLAIAPSLGIYVYQQYNFNWVIVISTLLCVTSFILMSRVRFQTPEAIKKTEKKDVQFSYFGSLIEKRSWYPALITLLTTFAYGSIVTYIVIFAQERGLEHIFLFYLFNATFASVSRPFSGKWFDRHGPKAMVSVCAIFAFAALWVLSFATSDIYIIIAGILFGIGYGSMLPSLQAWILSKTTTERRGVANGMYFSCIDGGIGLSAIVFGFISTFVSYGALFQIASFCFVAVSLLTVFAKSDNKQGQKPTQTKKVAANEQ